VVVHTLPFVGDDAAMVAAMRAGNRAAIAAFYDRHHAHVLRTLSRVLGPERELSDLHHDVLVSALGSLDELRDPAALRGWLTSIAGKYCIKQGTAFVGEAQCGVVSGHLGAECDGLAAP
jgi:RNA polymerase sigma-70 factor (ECF subfamily)